MKNDNIKHYLEQLTDENSYNRSQAALGLAHCRNRNIFPVLLPLTFDPEQVVRRDALISLGISQDSRAYFFLANYLSFAEESFPEKERIELQKSILFAFRANKDPRALELLQRIEIESRELKDLATSVLHAHTHHPRRLFPYTYIEKEEDRKNAEQHQGRIISSQADLQSLNSILEADAQWGKEHFEKPQTYVVNVQGKFLLGGELHEHVQVASGQNILAAGEAYMDKDVNGLWFIRELNNRSHGYYPHAHSFIHVKHALSQTDLSFPSAFSKKYPNGGWLDQDLLTINRSVLFQKKN
ncbi:MAG: HEAT repeat domain-containing protein [bacterium]|nr:HEAT repeat domain-containing protein [bacterium]